MDRRKKIKIFRNIVIALLVLIWAYLKKKKNPIFEDPSGVYTRRFSLVKDTLVLYPNGEFEQFIYDKNNTLKYHSKSYWGKKTLKSDIVFLDKLVITADEDITDYSVDYFSSYPNFGLKGEIQDNDYVMIWYAHPDLPETAMFFYREKIIK